LLQKDIFSHNSENTEQVLLFRYNEFAALPAGTGALTATNPAYQLDVENQSRRGPCEKELTANF